MSVPRVLLGNLEPMVWLGMNAVLSESGIEIVGSEERPQALVLLPVVCVRTRSCSIMAMRRHGVWASA